MVDTPSSIDDAADLDNAPSRDTTGGIDISQIMDSFGTISKKIDASVTDLHNTFNSIQQTNTNNVNAINAAATAQAEVNAIDTRANIELQKQNAKVAADFGVNPNASSYVLAELGHKMLAEKVDLDTRDAAISKQMDQSFWDDPLSFIANQFTLPLDIASYNDRLHKFEQDSDTITKLTAKATEAATVNAGIAEKDSAERLNEVNKVLFAKAAIDVSKSQMEMQRLGLDVIKVGDYLSEQKFNAMLQLNTALNQSQQLDLAKTKEAREEEMAQIQRDYRTWQLKDREEKQADRHAWQERLDKVTTLTGMNKISIDEFEHMTGDTKDALQKMMLDPNLDHDRVGASPVEILDQYNKVQAPLNTGMNIVRKHLIEYKNTAIKKLADTNIDFGKKSQAEQQYLANTPIQQRVDQEYANIPDDGGIYSAPPLLATLTIPNVSNLSIAKELAPIAANNPTYPTSANTVYNVAIQQILRNDSTPAQAASEIARMYNAINLRNTSDRQYRRFALDAPTKYNTSLNVTAGWGGSKIVDMTNATQLEALLTREVMRMKQNADSNLAPGF